MDLPGARLWAAVTNLNCKFPIFSFFSLFPIFTHLFFFLVVEQ